MLPHDFNARDAHFPEFLVVVVVVVLFAADAADENRF